MRHRWLVLVLAAPVALGLAPQKPRDLTKLDACKILTPIEIQGPNKDVLIALAHVAVSRLK